MGKHPGWLAKPKPVFLLRRPLRTVNKTHSLFQQLNFKICHPHLQNFVDDMPRANCREQYLLRNDYLGSREDKPFIFDWIRTHDPQTGSHNTLRLV